MYVLFKAYINFDSVQSIHPDRSESCIFLTAAQIQGVYLFIKLPMVYLLFNILGKLMNNRISQASAIAISFCILFTGAYAFILMDQFVIQPVIYHTGSNRSFGLASYFYAMMIVSVPCGAALAIKLFNINLEQRETQNQIVRQKLETELRFLKAQTNPHFLFNTLNNIYALARKKSEHTADVVLKLSKLLRFMLYESQKQSVSIGEEVQILEDYMELEKIRYPGKLSLKFNKSIDDMSQTIPPLILLPFLENAFKGSALEAYFTS